MVLRCHKNARMQYAQESAGVVANTYIFHGSPACPSPYERGLHSAVFLALLLCPPPQGCRGPDPARGYPGMDPSLPYSLGLVCPGSQQLPCTGFTTDGGTAALGYHFSYAMRGLGGTLQSNSVGGGLCHRYFQYRLTNKYTNGRRKLRQGFPGLTACGLQAVLPVAPGSVKRSTHNLLRTGGSGKSLP